MSARSAIRTWGLRGLAVAALLFAGAGQGLAQQQTAAEDEQQELQRRQFAPFVEGILAAPVFTTDSIPGHATTVRDLLMGPNAAAPEVPLEGVSLMELRSGRIETTLNGQTAIREVDDVWLVPRGARLSIRNLSEVAVIRTTTFVPRR